MIKEAPVIPLFQHAIIEEIINLKKKYRKVQFTIPVNQIVTNYNMNILAIPPCFEYRNIFPLINCDHNYTN